MNELYIEKLKNFKELDYRIQYILERNNIITFEHLINTDINTIKKLFTSRFEQRDIINFVHKHNCIIKNEYEEINISKEVGLTPISSLDIPKRIKRALLSHRLMVLGDILLLEPKEILNIKGIGEDLLIELRVSLNKLGFNIKNDKPTVNEMREKYKQENKTLLEEIFSSRIYIILYKNNIYTIEDLLKKGNEVFNLPFFGELRKRELLNTMNQHNLKFETPINTNQNLIEEKIKVLSKNNEEIKKRIIEKEELLKEYDRLIKEQQLLLEKEQELDKLLEEKKGVIHGRK